MKQKTKPSSTLVLTSRPITQQLLNLSNDNLSSKNKQKLALIIDRLFDDLELGHSCTKLSELASQHFNGVFRYVIQLLQQSNLVAVFKHAPENLIPLPITLLELPYDNHLLFITKYLQYELSIAKKIKCLSLANIYKYNQYNQYNQDVYGDCLSILEQTRDSFDMPNANQFLAIKNSIQNKISFITGGPGTGKTTTVVLLLWLMYQLYGNECKINICAPTGRAAKRVKDSILNSIGFFQSQNLPFDLIRVTQLLNESNNFTTIHKLLGAIKNKIHFRHNSDNKLKTEVLIVDESSMVGLALFSKLLNAVDDNNVKHIIFLGDKNQLSSVENGYVFASLISDNALVTNQCSPDLFSGSNYYVNSITELSVSKRSSGDIGLLANAVLNSNISQIESILSDSPAAALIKPSINNILNYYIGID
ncbi:MAG: exodeoxyribonuclease alpha subunit, partial [Pseudomonadota bacterium]|nr:exodeoxyribonuclease alpha subunit [Pseudomonadota bacterium]